MNDLEAESTVVALKLVSGEMVIGIKETVLSDEITILHNPLMYRFVPNALGSTSAMFTRFCMFTDETKSSFKNSMIMAEFLVTGLKRDYYYSMLKYIETFIDEGFDADIRTGIDYSADLIREKQLNEQNANATGNTDVDAVLKSASDLFKAFGGTFDPKKMN